MSKKIIIVQLESDMNPAGKTLKPASDGYYDVNFGKLNSRNTSGEFYIANERILGMFTDGKSYLSRMINDKTLYGEYDHPEMTDEMKHEIRTTGKQTKWLERQGKVKPDRYSHHIKSVALHELGLSPVNNKPEYLVTGRVKPFGPFGDILQSSLDNGSINTAFSIRTIAIEDSSDPQNIIVTILYLYTFDFVPRAGIPGSTDQAVMGYESDEEYNEYIGDEVLTTFSTEEQAIEIRCLEASRIVTFTSVLDNWV